MKNEHESVEKSLYSLPFLWAVDDPFLHQGTGVTAAFGVHRSRAAHTSITGLLSMTSCQKYWSSETGND